MAQNALGFDLNDFFSQLPENFDSKILDNDHLDKRDGRQYLRLELEALLQALKSNNSDETKTHLTNALIFRKYRYFLFPNAVLSENIVELNEGLAAYTGITMSRKDESEADLQMERYLSEFYKSPTFVSTFAYITFLFMDTCSVKRTGTGTKKL